MASLKIDGSARATVRIGGGNDKVRIGLPTGTVVFAEFDQGNLTPGGAIEDPTGSFSAVGFTINSAAASGVSMTNLTPANAAFFASNPYGNGYIWTAKWAAGSTYATTPVAMYQGFGGPGSIVFWIIDPTDLTYSSGGTGTFNYPVTFTPTVQATSFTE